MTRGVRFYSNILIFVTDKLNYYDILTQTRHSQREMEDDEAGPAAGVVVQPGKRKKVCASSHTTLRSSVCSHTRLDPFVYNQDIKWRLVVN